jgi:hypothetical protein
MEGPAKFNRTYCNAGCPAFGEALSASFFPRADAVRSTSPEIIR